jgi:hypothetical protein
VPYGQTVEEEAPVLREQDIRELGERIAGAMERLRIPGVAVGVVHGDEEHVAGFGVTNVEHPLPVDAELHEYAGRYAGVWQHFDLEVRVADGGLDVRRLPKGDYAATAPSPPQRFLFCGPDCVVPADDLKAARFDFVRRAGAVAWFRYSRALYPRLSDSASDQGR